MDTLSKTVLITGIRGFTGQWLKTTLISAGYKVYGLINSAEFSANPLSDEFACDITKFSDVIKILDQIKPDYIIHLAAISFVSHNNIEEIYQVNLLGTINLLKALDEINLQVKKLILASSATVYSDIATDKITESHPVKPSSHYANSKLAMEYAAHTYFDKFPIIITRPFNYTGVGQAPHFLIPKIVLHYQQKLPSIELGNIEVIRDFSDIKFVVSAYQKLLETSESSLTVNICSGQGHTIHEILSVLNKLAGYEIEIKINPAFIRKNEVKQLVGNNELLFKLIGKQIIPTLSETLSEMYLFSKN